MVFFDTPAILINLSKIFSFPFQSVLIYFPSENRHVRENKILLGKWNEMLLSEMFRIAPAIDFGTVLATSAPIH